jgi:PhzF family phenazine biosynthesis protein
MQNVAAEMNLSETAFLRRTAPGHFLLRWFTPTDEVDLCGHATLASSHALWEAGHTDKDQPIHFETLSGTLIASRVDNSGSIQLDFPSEAATAVILQDSTDSSPTEEETMRLLQDGLGLHTSGQILSVTRNRMDILVEVTPDAFKQQELDFGILGKLTDCRVLSVTTVGRCLIPIPGSPQLVYNFIE